MKLNEFAVEIATIWARANAAGWYDGSGFGASVVNVAVDVQRGLDAVPALTSPARPAASSVLKSELHESLSVPLQRPQEFSVHDSGRVETGQAGAE